MSVLDAFGLGEDALVPQIDTRDYPAPVQGRVAHIDADFISYQVSAESRDELDGLSPRKTFEDMQHNAASAIQHLMLMAGATKAVPHITPSGSNKGGRREQAVQQEYQATRAAKERPEYLDQIRTYIVQELGGIAHLDQEADDGMCQANYAAQGAGGTWGESNLSVIISADKDLRMVPGLHMDPITGEMMCVGDPFGSIYVVEKTRISPSTGKETTERTLKGWGTKFFWAQCLMGDTADNVKGLPAIPGRVAMTLAPTQAYTKAVAGLGMCGPAPTTPALQSQRKMFADQVAAMEAKTKPCGQITAYDILHNVYADKDAFQCVKELWSGLEKDHGYEFKHWQTGNAVTATQALLGDMQLLWMRRNKNPNDVVAWLKGA